jgi:hypothetical protein
MADTQNQHETSADNILTREQEEILDRYLQHLDHVLENIRESDKIQVEIETLHLKRILNA